MIVCGVNYMVIQNEKNEIYVCGDNRFGQLGLGDTKDRSEFEKIEYDFGQIKNIACSGYHTVIQNEKNEIYVCGWNTHGQLGLGDKKYRDKFERVMQNFGEIIKIACGRFHIVIQNEKNELYACGNNHYGQLDLGDNNNRDIFEKVTHNFREIKNIACGAYHTIIQNEKNEIYVCGRNGRGQLGLGDYKNRDKFEKVEYDFKEIKKIVCGDSCTIIQNVKNEIYVCGNNYYGQLGLGNNKDRNRFEKVEYDFGGIKKIACGYSHTVIQNEKNEIYVCGNNEYGQLGLGDYKHRNKFEKVEYNFGEIKKIACSDNHMIIQNEKNEIYVCGDNWCGQMGLEEQYEFVKLDTKDIFEKIYNFEFKFNTEEIEL